MKTKLKNIIKIGVLFCGISLTGYAGFWCNVWCDFSSGASTIYCYGSAVVNGITCVLGSWLGNDNETPPAPIDIDIGLDNGQAELNFPLTDNWSPDFSEWSNGMSTLVAQTQDCVETFEDDFNNCDGFSESYDDCIETDCE